MAAQLFKLSISADTETTTTTKPVITRYFYTLNETDVVGGTLTITADKFLDDAGNAVVGNLTTITPDNGYYLLFINGVLQQSDLYTVDEGGADVEITDADTIPADAPIVLVVTNFAPESTSTTTVTT